MRTASTMEIAWTVAVAVGLITNVVALWRAVADERDRRREGLNGPRALVLRGHVVHAVTQVLVQLLFLVAGIVALVTIREDPAAAYVAVAQLLAVVAIAGVGLYDMRARVRLRQAVERELQGARNTT